MGRISGSDIVHIAHLLALCRELCIGGNSALVQERSGVVSRLGILGQVDVYALLGNLQCLAVDLHSLQHVHLGTLSHALQLSLLGVGVISLGQALALNLVHLGGFLGCDSIGNGVNLLQGDVGGCRGSSSDSHNEISPFENENYISLAAIFQCAPSNPAVKFNDKYKNAN